MLSVSALECVRGERRLFANLDFSVAPHTLLEVRGANGSGKTTLLRTLCGLHVPEGGTITWNAVDIRTLGEGYRERVAYLGHLNAVNDDLTPIENLQFAARLAAVDAGTDDAAAALRWFGLENFLHQPCKTLSQGQRRRVALARLRLFSGKPLWILDEPFAALDSAAFTLAQSLLASHLDAGGMAILTTHQDLAINARHTLQIGLGT